MAWTNYRDVSVAGAGFQFEFSCESCGLGWRSPYKPYRMGQVARVLGSSSFLIGDLFSSFNKLRSLFGDVYKVARAGSSLSGAGANKAHDAALAEAQALADQRYHRCPQCKHQVCGDCWSDRGGVCATCDREQASGRSGGTASSDAAVVCPNCQTPSEGGRFCHECGFDMASTHKSCPGCGATQPRSARFCGDCGHAF